MTHSDVLLNVNSFHLELLRPLVKWKVLSIKELFEDSGYAGTYKGFHKVITRLEKHKLISGFKDVWTKSKRIYLTEKGSELVSPHRWRADVYNLNALFHDSRVTLYMRFLASYLNIHSLQLDQERTGHYRYFHEMPKVRPDAEFYFKDDFEKVHGFLLEVELTQKSSERIIEKLSYYQERLKNAKIIFLFPSENLARSYREVLMGLEKDKGKSQICFAYDQGLIQGNFSLERSYIWRNEEKITLQKYFEEIGRRSKGDPREILGRLWRTAMERSF